MREQLEKLVAEMYDRGILFEEAKSEFERRFITYALINTKGNLGKAASRLGIHRNTLSRKICEYRLKRKT